MLWDAQWSVHICPPIKVKSSETVVNLSTQSRSEICAWRVILKGLQYIIQICSRCCSPDAGKLQEEQQPRSFACATHLVIIESRLLPVLICLHSSQFCAEFISLWLLWFGVKKKKKGLLSLSTRVQRDKCKDLNGWHLHNSNRFQVWNNTTLL